MTRPLNVLFLEDNLADAKLMVYELQKAGFELDWHRVQTESDYRARLQEAAQSTTPLDIILSDNALPQFNAMQAFQLVQEMGLDIPFIVVSGLADEDLAAACIEQGVSAYLAKDNLSRLGPVVEQALEHK